MNTLGILGFSGHGKVIAEAALLAGWSNIVFYDDAWASRKSDSRWAVKGNTEQMLNDGELLDGVIVAIGNNDTRVAKANQLRKAGLILRTIVHPAAVVSSFSKIGDGSFIAAQACVQIDCQVGDMCILNTGATIDHDCVLKDGVHVSPGASLAGGVKVGYGSWIGIGAAIIQQVSIGKRVIVGAGSVVIKNVPDETVVVGIPAHKIHIHK